MLFRQKLNSHSIFKRLAKTLHRLTRSFAGRTPKLLQISCRGSIVIDIQYTKFIILNVDNIWVACEQQRCKPACAYAQSDQRLYFSFSASPVACQISFCCRADRLILPYLVANPEDLFSWYVLQRTPFCDSQPDRQMH